MLRFVIPFILCISYTLSAQENSHKQHRMDPVFQGKTVSLPPLSKATIRSENSKEVGYYHFAERRDVNLTPFNSGQWTRKPTEHTWTLDIKSTGAKMINLGFSEYNLPENAALKISSLLTGEQIGPFTKSDNKEHSQLWTPNLPGDNLRLELSIAPDQIIDLNLTLSAIHHGFRELESRSPSGSCNVDVVCGTQDLIPLIDNYRDQIRSVANIQINGRFMCSGFLINNGNNDYKPYFVTAAHCRITPSNAQSIVFYWNHENSTCRPIDSSASGNSGDGPLNQFTSGCTVISSAVDGNVEESSVDFTLLLLDEPVDPAFKPYYAGWDIRPILPDSSFVVHHPNGDEKRISFDFDKPRFIVYGSDSVFVRIENWELGTTEGGSSGGPHFNPAGLVIGQVSGGQASCNNRDGWDEFGWIGLAWKNGTSAETRLKDWLDPNNQNLTVLEGLDGSFSISIENSIRTICSLRENKTTFDITVDQNFENDVSLELIGLPESLTGTFDNPLVAPGGKTTLTIDNLTSLTNDTYTVQIKATDGINANTQTVNLTTISNVGDVLTPNFPLSTNNPVESLATFSWSGDGDTFVLEIAEDITFSTPVITSSDLSTRLFSTNQLIENSEYFWRVRSTNLCGQSPWSEPILFRTSNLDCEKIEDNEVNLIISQMKDDTIKATIRISSTEPIVDVSVPLIEGTHSWNSDLIITLISPMGTEVLLGNQLCDGIVQFMDFSIGFSDQGLPHSDIPCSFTDSRIYQPQSDLSVLAGENPQGEWTLQITDVFEFDGGTLDKFHLQVCTSQGKSLFTQFAAQTIDGCGTDVLDSSLDISADFDGQVAISAVPSSDDISVQLSTDSASPGDTIAFTINNINALKSEPASIRFITSDGTAESVSVLTISFDSQLDDISLLSPAKNAVIKTGDLIDLDWNDVTDATGYTVQLSTDFLFQVIDVEVNVEESIESILLDFVPKGQASTVYWRVIAQGNNCSKISDTSSFIADFTDAVFDVEDAQINIYPNPTTDELFIKSDSPLSQASRISLYDISGKRLQHIVVSQGQLDKTISLQKYTQGLYYLSFTTETESFVTKIVKN